MAEIVGEPRTTVDKESIARVELFTEAAKSPMDWEIVYHFETGGYDEAGNLVTPTRFDSRVVRRRFGDIIAEVTDGDTSQQLADKIKSAGYRWRQEDIDRAAQPDPQP